jgi:ABC-type bacteriocin/lantibiotic exporter with double-glycine peptidase domain
MNFFRWNSHTEVIRRLAFSRPEQAITCLSILFEYQGYMISASELRRGRPLSQCQYGSIVAMAEELGFSMTENSLIDLRTNGLSNLRTIVNLPDQGPVLLTSDRSAVWVNNPYTGIRKVIDKKHQAQLIQLKGVSLDPTRRTTHLKRKKSSLLWSLLLSDKSLYSVGAVIVLLSLIHGLVALLDPIIKNVYFTNVVQLGMVDWARTLAILYFSIAVAGGILLLAGSAFSLVLTNRLALKWSFNTYIALLRLPITYFSMRSRGDLMNRVRSSEQLGSFIGTDEIMLVGSALNLVLLFFVLASTSVYLALMLLIIQLLSLLYVIKTNGGWKTRSDRLQQQSGLEAGSFVSLVGNVGLLRQQKMTDNAFRVHQLAVNRRTRAQQDMSIYTLLVHFGSTSIDTFQSIILLTMAALLIMDGQITLGEYVAFQAILGSVLAPLKRIASFISSFQTLRATHDRILDVIEESSLQEKHGIGDKLNVDQLLTIELSTDSSTDDDSQKTPSLSIKSLSISREQKTTCLVVKSIVQSKYFEMAVGGERLLSEQAEINIAHRDGIRELLIARSTPHLYPGLIRDNITLGFPCAEWAIIKDLNELASLVGWAPERLARDVQELDEDELDLRRLSILRTLWRGASGFVLSDLDLQADSERRADLRDLIRNLGVIETSIVFITTEQPFGDIDWSHVAEISSLVDAMMAADQESFKG